MQTHDCLFSLLDPREAIDAVSRLTAGKHALVEEDRAQNPRRSEHRERFDAEMTTRERSGECTDSSNGVIPQIYHTVRKCCASGEYRVTGRQMVREVSPCHHGALSWTRCHPVYSFDVRESENRDVDDDYEVSFHHTPSLSYAKRRRLGLKPEPRLRRSMANGES